jgi:hypothetical protein
MAREDANCDCAVGRIVDRNGNNLRYAIEVMCFGDPSRNITKKSTRTASAWLRDNHNITLKFQSIAHHLRHHCNGAPRPEPEPKRVRFDEHTEEVLSRATAEDADAARDQATSSMQADLGTIDELIALSMGVARHMAAELVAFKPPADAPVPAPSPGEPEATPKSKKRGRSIADVQLFQDAGAMTLRAIKLKHDIQHGRKVRVEHGVENLKKGLLPIIRQMGQQLPPLEGDRPILMEQGVDGVFNPANMPREDDGELSEEDDGEFDEMDDDDAPDDGMAT